MKEFLVLLMLAPSVLMGQKEVGQIVPSFGLGYSLIGAIFSINDGQSDTKNFATPALVFACDYGITENFSVGLAGGWQKMGIEYTDYQYYDEDDNLVTEDFKYTISRTNVGVRALFHYTDIENLDMYSGAKVGYTIWNFTNETTDPYFVEPTDRASGMGFQIIAFGARGYFTESVGAFFEVGLFGAPYFLAGGIAIRV